MTVKDHPLAAIPKRLRPPETPTSVLDVGCGIVPQAVFPAAFTVALDAYRPYLEEGEGVRVCAKWQSFFAMLLDNAFEAVVALDFIEHLPKAEGKRFLAEACRVADYVLIYTPNGWLEQTEDVWHMGGEKWQTHRSAWSAEDFAGTWLTETESITTGNGSVLWAASSK